MNTRACYPARFIPTYACSSESNARRPHFSRHYACGVIQSKSASISSLGKKSECLVRFLNLRSMRGEHLAILLLCCASGNLYFRNHSRATSFWSLFSNKTCDQTSVVNPMASLNLCSVSMAASKELKSTIGRVNAELAAEQNEDDSSKLAPWLDQLKEEAVQRGVSQDTVVEALRAVEPSTRIIALDQDQPEVKLTAEAYLERMVDEYRVSRGVDVFLENSELLGNVSLHYGVPASVLTSIWGIESSYGSFSGSWNVIQSLLTLSYASPTPSRAAFFREELFHALFILDQGPAAASSLKGSWAGAMGQCQFMPSSYRSFAVDYDNDGHTDIWTSKADVFASMANYLVQHGWKTGGHFAQKVHAPADVEESLCGLRVRKQVREWLNDHGVVPEGDLSLPQDEMASLVVPDGPSGRAYLVCDNFRAVMRYNNSTLYSVAVYELAREIDSRAVARPQVA